MLTTAGLASWAMFRNVVASIGPLIGALLAAGTLIVPAIEDGVRSSREASTMPATRLTRTIKTP